MALNRQEIFEQVQETLVEALGVDEDEVTEGLRGPEVASGTVVDDPASTGLPGTGFSAIGLPPLQVKPVEEGAEPDGVVGNLRQG